MQKWVELRKLISPNWRSLLPGQFIRNCQIDLVCLFCAVGNRVANCTNVALYHPFVKSHRVGQSEESNMFTSLLDPSLIIVHPYQNRSAHCYALFLCSWDDLHIYSLVGQLISNWLTRWFSDCCWVDLIEVTLPAQKLPLLLLILGLVLWKASATV